MAAQPNVAGIARLLYLIAGVGVVAWALLGADAGWTKWTWLVIGGALSILGLIGYSPLHAIIGTKDGKAI